MTIYLDGPSFGAKEHFFNRFLGVDQGSDGHGRVDRKWFSSQTFLVTSHCDTHLITISQPGQIPGRERDRLGWRRQRVVCAVYTKVPAGQVPPQLLLVFPLAWHDFCIKNDHLFTSFLRSPHSLRDRLWGFSFAVLTFSLIANPQTSFLGKTPGDSSY